ncbi:MAG: TonB-dependent receptor [Alphaproteobacteria bacterium]|nr:TonB-dependent receptor [Alphaproteobacteria bacterium]
MADLRQILPGAAVVLALSSVPAAAQDDAAGPAAGLTLPPVEVVGATPLLGSGVDRNKVPAETHVLTDQDISRNGYPQALRALNEDVPGVTLDAAAGNPFQPNLLYHGFLASPLQGNPQGLAVYVNGARFNQPFGDTVNWDLIPDLAIDRMDLVGSNPVFGLNALGGALSVRMKNGFTYQGGELDLLGGSFAHYQGNLQYGVQSDNVAAYVAATGLHEGGWRDLQSSNLGNFYGDLGWRGYGGEVHINVTAAQTRLNGPGTSPVELLGVNPSAQFTAPNLITNQYAQVNLTGSYDINDTTSLQGLAYYTYLQQKVINGNVADLSPCNDGSGLLCQAPGVVGTDVNGNPIPNFLNGGPYSDLDQQSTNTNGYGASIQVTNSNEVLDRANQLIAGFSFDGAQTLFAASTQIGGLSLSDRVFVGPGITIDQADGSIAPVRLGISDAYYGAFFTDTLDVTPQLSANVAGRYNLAQIDLRDQLGSALTGNHTFSRFNPAGGLSYKLLPGLTAYASYADANRAPTPAELSCASAASPCSLANFFTGDPNLQQVVSHTIEAGLRSQFHPSESATVSANIAYYRSTLNNDILFVNSPIQGRAFFQNVGTTLRQGVDLSAQVKTDRLLAWIAYSYIDATFQTGFTASSENNPGANASGNIQVQPGNHLPGIPNNLWKLGVDYKVTDAWTVGGTGVAASGQFLVGDEANLTAKTPAYFVLNFHTSYQITRNLQLFGLIENAFNTTYYTFGTFSPTSSVPIVQAPGAANPRSYSPAAPIAGTIGIRLTF